MATGHPSTRVVKSGRQLGLWKPSFRPIQLDCVIVDLKLTDYVTSVSECIVTVVRLAALYVTAVLNVMRGPLYCPVMHSCRFVCLSKCL